MKKTFTTFCRIFPWLLHLPKPKKHNYYESCDARQKFSKVALRSAVARQGPELDNFSRVTTLQRYWVVELEPASSNDMHSFYLSIKVEAVDNTKLLGIQGTGHVHLDLLMIRVGWSVWHHWYSKYLFFLYFQC